METSEVLARLLRFRKFHKFSRRTRFRAASPGSRPLPLLRRPQRLRQGHSSRRSPFSVWQASLHQPHRFRKCRHPKPSPQFRLLLLKRWPEKMSHLQSQKQLPKSIQSWPRRRRLRKLYRCMRSVRTTRKARATYTQRKIVRVSTSKRSWLSLPKAASSRRPWPNQKLLAFQQFRKLQRSQRKRR